MKKVAHSSAVGEGAGVGAKTVRTWVTDFCKDGKFVVRDRPYTRRQQPVGLVNPAAGGGDGAPTSASPTAAAAASL